LVKAEITPEKYLNVSTEKPPENLSDEN